MNDTFPKLSSIKVKNFRCIGNEEVTIDLDNTPIHLGKKHPAKNTILRAYELAVSSKEMTIDDFHKKEIDPDNLPEVEIHTLVDTEVIPKQGSQSLPSGKNIFLVKERWKWQNINAKPKRVSWMETRTK